MKTNQIMKRPLANFTVEQRTKDGMFCATALLKQWNEQDGVVQRNLTITSLRLRRLNL